MKFEMRFQTLLALEKTLAADSELATNFLIRRARLKASGYVLNSNLSYKMELGLSNRDISPSRDFDEVGMGSRVILDAFFKYRLRRNFSVLVGCPK